MRRLPRASTVSTSVSRRWRPTSARLASRRPRPGTPPARRRRRRATRGRRSRTSLVRSPSSNPKAGPAVAVVAAVAAACHRRPAQIQGRPRLPGEQRSAGRRRRQRLADGAVPVDRRVQERRHARRLRRPGAGHARRGAPRRRRGHHQRRRPVVRLDAGPGRQPVPLRAPAHAGRRAGHAPGAEGLDQPVLQALARPRGCTSATSSPSPRPTAAGRSSASRTSSPTLNTQSQDRARHDADPGGEDGAAPAAHVDEGAPDRRPLPRHDGRGPRAGHQPDLSRADSRAAAAASSRPDRLHHHRHGPAVPRARAGRPRPARRVPDPEHGHELPGRRAARRRVLQALQAHDRHRGAPQLPREEHPRRRVPAPAARRSAADIGRRGCIGKRVPVQEHGRPGPATASPTRAA